MVKILLDTLKYVFWCRKDVKCNMKIKNTNPTPKSMTHKKPIYMSESLIIE